MISTILAFCDQSTARMSVDKLGGTSLLIHEFTFWDPLDISILGIKMSGSFSIRGRLGNILGECSFRATIK